MATPEVTASAPTQEGDEMTSSSNDCCPETWAKRGRLQASTGLRGMGGGTGNGEPAVGSGEGSKFSGRTLLASSRAW